MYYQNSISGNWLFGTWRNGKTLQEVSDKWNQLFELNNVDRNENWVTEYQPMSIIHILPIDDLEEHEENFNCKCEPKLTYEGRGKIITHNSFDRRELIEQVIEVMNSEDFGYCKHEIEGNRKCTEQCDHCKTYYKPLEDNL